MRKQRSREFCLDSCPFPVEHNVRAGRARLRNNFTAKGYSAAKEHYFFGFKLHSLTLENGQVVEFYFCPANRSDQVAFALLDFKSLPANAQIHANKAYNNYVQERALAEAQVYFYPLRKKNALHIDNKPEIQKIRQKNVKKLKPSSAKLWPDCQRKFMPQTLMDSNGKSDYSYHICIHRYDTLKFGNLGINPTCPDDRSPRPSK